MDSFEYLDSVQVEKANALARYNLFINIAKMFQFIEVFIAVAFISWSLPRFLSLSGESLLAFASYLLNQHVVFLLGNVIIVVCYVFSGLTEAGIDSGEICDEKFSLLNEHKTTGDISIGELVPPPVKETAREEDQNLIVRCEKAIVKSETEMEAELAIKKAAKQIEKFLRTQSEKLKRQISMKQTLEEPATAGSGRAFSTSISFETVDKLCNEEFRLAVESFISKQQSFLKQQSMAENGTDF